MFDIDNSVNKGVENAGGNPRKNESGNINDDDLDKLYVFSKHYSRMSPQEKIIFLHEAEKVSDAFEKVPSMIWEDEYQKYRDVMDIYRNIKIERWKEASK